MHRSPSRPPQTRSALVALALLVAVTGAACGVEASDAGLAGPGPGPAAEPGDTPLPPCAPDEGGGTGGAIGLDDLDPTCEQPDEPETTTTEAGPDEDPDTTTTTEPDDDEQQGSPDQVYLDAMIESLQEGESDDLSFTDAEAECLAPLWLETITVDAFREADITPEDLASDTTDVDLEPLLDQDQGIEMVEAFGTCGIDLEQIFLDGLTGEGSIEAGQVACLADALPDGYVDRLFAITFSDGDEALDADPELAETLTDAFVGCTE